MLAVFRSVLVGVQVALVWMVLKFKINKGERAIYPLYDIYPLPILLLLLKCFYCKILNHANTKVIHKF